MNVRDIERTRESGGEQEREREASHLIRNRKSCKVKAPFKVLFYSTLDMMGTLFFYSSSEKLRMKGIGNCFSLIREPILYNESKTKFFHIK